MKRHLYAETFILLVLICFAIPMARGQNYSFKDYGAEFGIPDEFIYTLNQSDNGFLWVGTGKGLARFDGYEFERVQFPDSVEGRIISASLKDKNGTVWFGCNDGTLFFLDGNSLEKFSLDNNRTISQIIEGPDDLIYIIPQGRSIFSIDSRNHAKKHQYFISGDPVMYSASFTGNGYLLIGIQGKILSCRLEGDSVKVKDYADDFDYSGVNAICPDTISGSYYIGTEYMGLFRMEISESGMTVSRFRNRPAWETMNISSLYFDQEGRLWVSTFGAGVIRFKPEADGRVSSETHFDKTTGLLTNDAKLVFRDFEGNFWIGLFSAGLHMLSSNALSYYTPGKNTEENNILYSTLYNGIYFLGTPTGYHLFDPVAGRSLSFTDIASMLGGAIVQSWFIDEKKNIWIGTDGKGLYVRSQDGSFRNFFRSGDSGSDKINDIGMDDENIWLGTTNGVIVVDRKTGRQKSHLSMNDGLAYNNIYKILAGKEIALIGTESEKFGIIHKDFSISESGCFMNGSTKTIITGITRTPDGAVWAATKGNGIFECRNDSVRAYTRADGLFSNYCYSIFCDSDGYIWVGHGKGISRFDRGKKNFRTFDSDYAGGGSCNPAGLFEAPDGKILIGTNKGLVVYDGRLDEGKKMPPYNNINSIIINDVEYPFQKIIELPYKTYRITFNYSGISFSDPKKVYYSTFLENYDEDFSEMKTDRKISYSLRDGSYIFHLVSVNENSISREPETTIVINIAKPVFKKVWFIILVVLLLAAIVVLIIRQRDLAQKRVRKYLEEELEKRTSLIMKQKAEIELQNFEIKDSINYAKRIQSSILPDATKLKETFPESFILFQPRDIVSGDFYWFAKVDDERFLIVCADSTGHGVPGAFMSMIGSTLLQDIINRKNVTRPSQVLSLLDKEIFAMLNQNSDLGVENDGMDMVICEMNILTRHVTFSSAMRPIIIVIGGESNYIKGSRSSVGGESAIDKYFVDQEYYLNPGDTIYLFSDGLPDQFGGEDGKKMKIARLKKIIDQISVLPMGDQENAVLNFFQQWKGKYEQVDDVLLMGIRV